MSELAILFAQPDFQQDWLLPEMHAAALDKLGPLAQGYRFCLKMPVLLGGEYTHDNLGTAPLVQLLRVAGTVAKQLQ